MKKWIVLILMALFLASCGHYAGESEYLQHKSMYKNWDHMKFSWFGHRNPTAEESAKAVDQQWWGYEVPYVPGQ